MMGLAMINGNGEIDMMDRFEFDCERCNQPIGYDEDIVIETDFSCERICEKCVTDEERKIHSDQWS